MPRNTGNLLSEEVSESRQSARHNHLKANARIQREKGTARPDFAPSSFPDPSPPTNTGGRGQENGHKIRAGGKQKYKNQDERK